MTIFWSIHFFCFRYLSTSFWMIIDQLKSFFLKLIHIQSIKGSGTRPILAILDLLAKILTLCPLSLQLPTSNLWSPGPTQSTSLPVLAISQVSPSLPKAYRRWLRSFGSELLLWLNYCCFYCCGQCIWEWCVCYKFESWHRAQWQHMSRNCRPWLETLRLFIFIRERQFRRRLLRLQQGW